MFALVVSVHEPVESFDLLYIFIRFEYSIPIQKMASELFLTKKKLSTRLPNRMHELNLLNILKRRKATGNIFSFH